MNEFNIRSWWLKFKNSCCGQKFCDELETLRKLYFGPNLEKNREIGHQSRKGIFFSLYHYIKLKYKILDQYDVKRRS